MFSRTALSASTWRLGQGTVSFSSSSSSSCSAHSLLLSRSFQSAAQSSRHLSTFTTTSPLRSYLLNRSSTRSLFTSSTRPAATSNNGSAPSTSFFFSSSSLPAKQSKTSVLSRSYTSLPSPPSSSSSATATAARVLAEESSSSTSRVASATVTAATAGRTVPLSFHEEMTKVRFSFNWWKEWTIIMGVFAVTGSSTVMVVKPILKEVFQLDGSMKEGPWSFRFAYLCTTLPLYSCVLLTVATVAGRRPYFKKVVLRMWGRFLPKKVIQRFQ